jgi:hypothetical protein
MVMTIPHDVQPNLQISGIVPDRWTDGKPREAKFAVYGVAIVLRRQRHIKADAAKGHLRRESREKITARTVVIIVTTGLFVLKLCCEPTRLDTLTDSSNEPANPS